jgi:hypothetical protein
MKKTTAEQPGLHQEFISNTEILIREISFSGLNFTVSVKSGYPDDTMKILKEMAMAIFEEIKENKE